MKVTGGGGGNILSVIVFIQPTTSTTSTVVIPTGNPVAVKEFPETDPGGGLQVIEAGTEAEPAVVNVTMDKEFVQLT